MLPGEVLYKQREGEFTEKGKPQGQRLAVFTHDFQERERETASGAKLHPKRHVSSVRQGGSNQDLRQQRFLTTNIATDTGLFPDKRGPGEVCIIEREKKKHRGQTQGLANRA